MPVALVQFKFSRLAHLQPAWVAGGIALVALGAGSLLFGTSVSAESSVRFMYPAMAPAVEMIEVPDLSVRDVVKELPIGLRFNLLLINGGVMPALGGDGSYTLFVPADNYFDYLAPGAYISLNRAEESKLAAYHVVSHVAISIDQARAGDYITLAGDQVSFVPHDDGSVSVGPDGAFILRGYHANNGVVYIVNRVLVPHDLKQKLEIK